MRSWWSYNFDQLQILKFVWEPSFCERTAFCRFAHHTDTVNHKTYPNSNSEFALVEKLWNKKWVVIKF